MFNLQGSEIIFILLLALVVLGPEKLPSAIRRFMQTYTELRKMGTGFQTELKSALDEPMREMKETADLIKEAADPAKVASDAEDAAEAAAEAEHDAERKLRAQQIVDERKARQAAAGVANMNLGPLIDDESEADLPVTAAEPVVDDEPLDEWADPVQDIAPVSPIGVEPTGSSDAPAEVGAEEASA